MKKKRKVLVTTSPTSLEQIAADQFGDARFVLLLKDLNAHHSEKILPTGASVVLPLDEEQAHFSRTLPPSPHFDPAQGAGTTTKRKWAQMRAGQRTDQLDPQEPYRLTEHFLKQGLTPLSASQRLRTMCQPEQLKPFLNDTRLSGPLREVADTCQFLEDKDRAKNLLSRLRRLFEATSTPKGRKEVVEAATKYPEDFFTFFTGLLFPKRMIQSIVEASPACFQVLHRAMELRHLDPMQRLTQIEHKYAKDKELYLSLSEVATNADLVLTDGRLEALGISKQVQDFEAHLDKLKTALEAGILESDELDAETIHALLRGQSTASYSQQQAILARLLSHFSDWVQDSNLDSLSNGLGDLCLQYCRQRDEAASSPKSPASLNSFTVASLSSKAARASHSPEDLSDRSERISQIMVQLFERMSPSAKADTKSLHVQKQRRARAERAFFSSQKNEVLAHEIRSQCESLILLLENQMPLDGCLNHQVWTRGEKNKLAEFASTLTFPVPVHKRNISEQCRALLLVAMTLEPDRGQSFAREANRDHASEQISRHGGRIVSLAIEKYVRGLSSA